MPHLRHLIAISVLLSTSLTSALAADKLAPGKEGPLEIPGNSHPSVIYIPKDYKDGVQLPLILFMHGSGGQPTSWPFKTATKGEGYIIVGLAYGGQEDAGKSGIRGDPKTCKGMLEYINQARALVKDTYGINEKQVFLTGLSMGGWGVNMYGLKKEAKGLYRGYAILAAGPEPGPDIDFTVAKGLPVLLLNGEKCPNLAVANKNKPLLEKAGAIVTQVVLEGQGHVPSPQTMDGPLSAWLKENGPLQEVLATLTKAKAAEQTGLGAALTLYESALAMAGATTDPEVKEARAHYEQLAAAAKGEWDSATALAEQKKYGPCMTLLEKLVTLYRGHETARKAEKKIQELRAQDEVKKALAADATRLAQDKTAAAAEQALAKAQEPVQAKDYPKAAEMLAQVSAQYPGTPAAGIAAEQLQALSADPRIAAAIEAARAGKECRALLSKARNYHANGMSADALKCLDQIMEKFPKSTWAADAQALKTEWK